MSRLRQRQRRREKRRQRRADIGSEFIPLDRVTLSDERLGGTLPVLPRNPLLDAPGVRHDDDSLLHTGVTVRGLVGETERWWETKGRKQCAQARRSQVRQVRGTPTKLGPFTLDPGSGNFFPSGLLHGWPWDRLTRDEKLRCCKAFHEIKYAKPQRAAEETPHLIH